MNKLARRALFVIVIGGGSLLTIAWAQQPDKSNEPTPAQKAPIPGEAPDAPDAPEPPHIGGFGGPHGGMGMGGMGMSFGRGRFGGRRGNRRAEREEIEALHQAVEKLRTAKTDAEKKTAAVEVSKLLEKSFQRDMEWREKQVSEVEARVKKLRDQIEKRKKAKDEIISLRLKTIVNEAEGLGFPGSFGPESDFVRRPGNWGFRPQPQFEIEESEEASPPPVAVPLDPPSEDAQPGPPH
ncbi:MAG TPA: hypothetical protein VEI07_18725 [Planctomycetaceae bacterium]|nr:hypothetical protein [Planctomycetaceae bacterium]